MAASSTRSTNPLQIRLNRNDGWPYILRSDASRIGDDQTAARIEKVAKLLREQGVKDPDQHVRTAWKNLHD
jgi:hypothetical protein